MAPSIQSKNFSNQGFSLVEVALAVAIASLGIITCLGLLPEGIEMSRKTGLLAINSNIMDQVVRDIENARNWKALKANYNAPAGFSQGGDLAGEDDKTKYYDYQGTPVPANSNKIAFVVKIDYDLNCFLPGENADQPYLARLRIRIANSSNPSYAFPVPSNGAYVTFYHFVSKAS